MKKKLLLCSIIFIFLVLLINIPSFAVSVISDYDISAKVLKNGDMEVTETVIYYSDEHNGEFVRNIELENKDSAINSAFGITFQMVKVNDEIYSKKDNPRNGEIGYYSYNISPERHQIKVYVPSSRYDEYIVTYVYILHNVAVEYNDKAEVYWNFIEEDLNYDIENFTINMTLPRNAASDDILTYTYGLGDAQTNQNSRYIRLHSQNISTNQSIGVKVLFSLNAISDGKKVIDEDYEEIYVYAETEELEAEEILFGFTITEIAVILDIIILIVMISSYIFFDKEDRVKNAKYMEQIPNNLSPEILQYIYCGKAKSNSFYIAVLSLIKLGVYKLEKTINTNGEGSLKLVYIPEYTATLKSYQLDMVDMINNCLEFDENGISCADLDSIERKLSIFGRNGFKKFEKAMEEERRSLAGKVKKAPTRVVLASALVMISLIIFIVMMGFIISPEEEVLVLAMFLGITTFVYSLLFASLGNTFSGWIFIIAHASLFQIANVLIMYQIGIVVLYPTYLLMFIYIQYLIRIKKHPKEERQILADLNALKRYIRDYPMNREKNMNLWEDYFIISVAFGFSNKTVNYFYNYGKRQNTTLGISLRDTLSYTSFNYLMYRTFDMNKKTYTISNLNVNTENNNSVMEENISEDTYFTIGVEDEDDKNSL